MLNAALAAGIPCGFFLGDEVYSPLYLRKGCRELGVGYALAVKSDHRITTGRGKLTAKGAVGRLPAAAWQRMRTGTGSKGARDYDWAMIDAIADDVPAGQADAGVSVLLARRHRYTARSPTSAAGRLSRCRWRGWWG
nr:hypothetical protein [Mangrovactinospora gilvigrisea]